MTNNTFRVNGDKLQISVEIPLSKVSVLPEDQRQQVIEALKNLRLVEEDYIKRIEGKVKEINKLNAEVTDLQNKLKVVKRLLPKTSESEK